MDNLFKIDLEIPLKIEMEIPISDRRKKKLTGMTRLAREMPINGSILFATESEALSCITALRQNYYHAARRKRTIEKHGESGWRVWKLGDRV